MRIGSVVGEKIVKIACSNPIYSSDISLLTAMNKIQWGALLRTSNMAAN